MATGYITGGLKPLIEKVNVEEKIPWLDGSYSTEIFGAEDRVMLPGGHFNVAP